MTEKSAVTISVYAQTNVGKVRRNNEDNFLLADLTEASYRTATEDGQLGTSINVLRVGDKGFLAAVSDGMGGALAGEIASQLAVDVVRLLMQRFQSTAEFAQFPLSEQFRLAIEQANKMIHEQSQSSLQFSGMGATFTGATYAEGNLYLAQVGDSRAYVIRGGQISQATRDQSLVGQLVDAGYLTEEQAQEHVYKNVILQALGAQPDTVVVLDRLPVCQNDVLVLCSDGLSNKVSGSEIAHVVTSEPDLERACQRLIEMANDRGGEDNITVIVCRFEGVRLPVADLQGAPQVERIERDSTLPLTFLPGLFDPRELLDQAMVHADHPPDTNEDETEPDEEEPAPEETTAEATDPVLFEAPRHNESTGVERHIGRVLIALLVLIILAAALAIAWYLKTRGDDYLSPSDAQLPSLTRSHQAADQLVSWASVIGSPTKWLDVHALDGAKV